MRLVRNEGGVSAVEFALVLPLLVVLTLGMFSGGLAFHTLLSLDHAAREGARYGATLEVKKTDDGGLPIPPNWDAYLADVATQTMHSATGELDGDDPGAFVCVAWISADGSVVRRHTVGEGTVDHASRCYEDTRSDDRVQVLVRRDAVIDAVFFRLPVPLTSTALARYEKGA